MVATVLAIVAAAGVSADRAMASAGGSSTIAASTTANRLTGSYPLGTRKLCCRTHSTGTTGSSASSTPRRSGSLTPRRSGSRATSGGRTLDIALIAVGLLVLFLAAVVVYRRRRSTDRDSRPRSRDRQRPPRPRRAVAPRTVAVLRPLMRYSNGRDAYVLRLVGRWYGPVVVKRRPARRPSRPSARDAPSGAGHRPKTKPETSASFAPEEHRDTGDR